MDCNICCDYKYTITSCPFCNKKACMDCWKIHVKSSISSITACMFCKKEWDTLTMYNIFGKTFMEKNYIDIRKKILFDVFSVMDTVPRYYALKKLEDKKQNIQKNIYKSKQDLDHLKTLPTTLDIFTKINDISIVLSENTEILKNTNKSIKFSKEHLLDTKPIIQRETFNCAYLSCQGRISQKQKCTICKNTTCSTCHLLQKENHKCDEKDVSSVELLKKDSKQCPRCKSLIFRTSGCSQMWCVLCKTPFDWNTGTILNLQGFHNPHMNQEIRINVLHRELDVQCNNRILEQVPIIQIIEKIKSLKLPLERYSIGYTR